MVFSNIEFKNFQKQKNNNRIKKIFKGLISSYLSKNNQLLLSLSKKYKFNFNFQKKKKYKKFKNIRVFGMGGSIHGVEAIYFFLNKKIKKNLNSLIILIFQPKKI